MNSTKLNPQFPYIASTAAVYCLLLVVWELAVSALHISPLTLVRPSEIIPVVVGERAVYWKALLYTLTEVCWGWGIGNALAVMTAVFLYRYGKLARLMVSGSVLVNAVPLVALSAIIAGFLGTGILSKIVVTALICFFPMFISALTGFTRLDPNQEHLLQTYACSGMQKFRKLVWPNAMPYIMTALKLNVLNAIFAAITSEFFGSFGGIGQLILANRGLYNLGMVWGAIVYVVAAGAIFYFAVSMLQKRIVHWKQ